MVITWQMLIIHVSRSEKQQIITTMSDELKVSYLGKEELDKINEFLTKEVNIEDEEESDYEEAEQTNERRRQEKANKVTKKNDKTTVTVK